MFKGYLELGGTELLNAQRVADYVENQLPAFPLQHAYDTKDLREALEDEPYTSPLVDDAPWVDPSNPATYGFYGFYPLDIQGMIDDTRSATITQSLGDGGFASATRKATREIQVKAMGIARDVAGADAGMAWLRSALDASNCGGDDCGGQQLCYFIDAPTVCDVYGGGPGAGSGGEFGRVDTSNSPMTFRFPDFSPARAHAEWFPIYADGAVVRWGAMDTDSSDIIQIDGNEVRLQRTNWMPNPSFTNDLTGWTQAGSGTFSRVTSGGVDDGPYARMAAPTGAVVKRTNWIGNSGVRQLPTWSTNNGAVISQQTNSPAGVLSGDRSPFSVKLTGGVGASFDIPVLLPLLSLATLSWDILGGQVTVALINSDGTTAYTLDYATFGAWQRLSWAQKNFGPGAVIRVTKRNTADVYLTDFLLDSSTSTTWFDGDLASVAGRIGSWDGVADQSTSTGRSTTDFSTLKNLFNNPSFELAGAATAYRTNLATNPALEGGATTNWTFWAGTAPGAAAGAVSTTGGAAFGLNFYRVTWSTAPGAPGGGGVIYDTSNTMSPNTTYTLSMYVRASVASNVYMISQFYNGGAATTAVSTASTPTALAANVWTRLSMTVTTGAADNHIQFRVYNSGNTFVAGSTLDGDAMLIETGSLLLPYFDGSTVVTNLSANPRGVNATGLSPNNSTTHLVTRNQPITGHPQGIATAVKTQLQTGQTGASTGSFYNVEGLGTSGPNRYLGLWVYANSAGYQAAWTSNAQIDPLAVALQANTWTFLVSPSAFAAGAYSGFSISKTAGSAGAGDFAYVTGIVAQDADSISQFYDAALNDYTCAWTATANASTSTMSAPGIGGTSMGNGFLAQSVLSPGARGKSARMVPTSSSTASTLIVGNASTGAQGHLDEGKTYTILATRTLFRALTGALNSSYAGRAALITTNLGAQSSDQILANVPGTADLRWTFTVPVGAGATTLRLGHGGAQGSGDVFWDNILLVEGTYTGPYFDGSTTTTTTITYLYGDSGESIQYVTTSGLNTVTTDALDTYSSAVTLSLGMRTSSETSVLVEALDAGTGALIGSAVINPDAAWSRQSVAFPWGRTFKLRFTSAGSYSLDQALLELGTEARDYFDGDSIAPAGYITSWMSLPEASASQIKYALPMTTERSDSTWRPFLALQEGFIPGGEYSWGVEGPLPFDTSFVDLERHVNDVTAIVGATEVEFHDLGPKGVMFVVTYGLSAQKPYIFGTARTLLRANPGDLVSEVYHDNGEFLTENMVTDPMGASTANYISGQSGGNVTLARTSSGVSTIGLPVNYNGAAMRSTMTAAGTDIDITNNRLIMPVVAGSIMSFSAYGLTDASVIAGISTTTQLIFFNDAGAQVGTSITQLNQPKLLNTVWTRYLFENITIPAGATTARFVIRHAGTAPIGHWIQMAALQANAGPVAKEFVAGGMGDIVTRDYAWVGAPNASASMGWIAWECATFDVDASLLDDPDCVVLPAPPRPPAVPAVCVDDNTQWNRYFIDIDADEVAAWGATVPTIALTTLASDIRQIRVRLFPNPFGYGKDQFDNCSWCSEFILSYLPGSTTLTIDGEVKRATASVGGRGDQPADQLLYGTGGAPIVWPEMSCGVPYWMTVDIPATVDAADLGIELAVTRRE